MEISNDMDDGDILVFAGMIIEVLANKHNVTQERMVADLIEANKSWPMTFDKKNHDE